MGDVIQFPADKPKAESLRELEVANQNLINQLASFKVGIDGASMLALRLDLLLEQLLDDDARIEFELGFQLKLHDMLKNIVRQAQFAAPSGLVIPK